MLTKGKHCCICALIDENKISSRMLWSCMYTMFFTAGWVSFYSTELCAQLLMTKTNLIRTRGIYMATGFVVCWLLFLIVPLATNVIHEITKERVKLILKRVWWARLLGDCLIIATYPLFSILLKMVFSLQGATLWSWLGLVGAVFCLFVFYLNPGAYGVELAFTGLLLGVFLGVDGRLQRVSVFTIIILSDKIADAHREIIADKASIIQATQKKVTSEKVAEMQNQV